MASKRPLTKEDEAIYEWQMWVPDFGREGQQKLKNASVLVSRCGGLGSVVAYELAAAGVGRLVVAHAGKVKHSDLNRQLLMTYGSLGKSRVASAAERLRDLNPHMEIVPVAENVSEDNADRLVEQVDVVVDCAPLFSERFAMSAAATKQNKPVVMCAMHDMEIHITTMVPGRTPCLSCIYPEDPTPWKREFPVFGAVSGMVGCLGAIEAIKVIAGLGEPLLGELLTADLRTMAFRKFRIAKNPQCPVCSGL